MKKQQKCYIYTRVSTSMQVEGYSLDAQKDKLRKYADYQEMSIVGEYSDEGKSGKSVEGRPQFKQMLADIESGKDNVDYVLVFKLSRFGRNAADVLSSLQKMQDYGVNLICVEDGIDSSKDAGKLMISVLSAVAEIERENILVQTMEGRRQDLRFHHCISHRLRRSVDWMSVRILICLNLRMQDSHSVHRRRKMRLYRRLGILELYRLWISSIVCLSYC